MQRALVYFSLDHGFTSLLINQQGFQKSFVANIQIVNASVAFSATVQISGRGQLLVVVEAFTENFIAAFAAY